MFEFIFWWTLSGCLVLSFAGLAVETYREHKAEKIARAEKARRRAEKIRQNRVEIIENFEKGI